VKRSALLHWIRGLQVRLFFNSVHSVPDGKFCDLIRPQPKSLTLFPNLPLPILCQMNMLYHTEICKWLWVLRFERQTSVAEFTSRDFRKKIQSTWPVGEPKIRNSNFPNMKLTCYLFNYWLFNSAFNTYYNTTSTIGIGEQRNVKQQVFGQRIHRQTPVLWRVVSGTHSITMFGHV
jgi:hypothetical protein